MFTNKVDLNLHTTEFILTSTARQHKTIDSKFPVQSFVTPFPLQLTLRTLTSILILAYIFNTILKILLRWATISSIVFAA